MQRQAAYEALLSHLRQTAALQQVAELLHWDQEACMPVRGGAARAEQCAAIESALHERRSDPRIDDWLEAVGHGDGPFEPDGVARVNLREVRRRLDRSRRVPARLVSEMARLASAGHGIWAEARRQKQFSQFAPTLERIITLKREEATCLADGAGGDALYDALLDDFEPGATAAELAVMLTRLRGELRGLLARIVAASARSQPAGLTGEYSPEAQLAVARELSAVLGYDFQAGRLDLAVHPFTSGAGGDVRITTRVDRQNFFDCLYSTIHEVGHALYEQGIDPALALTPAGEAASMGVHESQSRLWENQIGRSRAFLRWLHPRLVAAFGAQLPVADVDGLYRLTNRVEPSFIRTEADEVTYNLHIILRFDLERALLSGDLAVRDLEGAWNDRMQADLGIVPPDASQGVLQDVHWSAGLFGYFPTYTLGNVYAGELHAALRRELPDLDGRLAAGQTGAVLTWLRDRVHRHGKTHVAGTLIEQAVGHPPTERPLLDYLEAKYGELYSL